MNSVELFEAGKLAEALDAALLEVKKAPADTGKRVHLAYLALFQGDLDRADNQLDVVAKQAPERAVGIALLRQLIRGEIARQQFYSDGRSPTFLADEDPVIQRHLEAAVTLRDGDADAATALLDASNDFASGLSGTCNEKAFTGLRDLDDLLGPVLEVITPNGKYYWVNMQSIESLEFHPPERLPDLFWRRVSATIHDGPQGDIYIPTLYAGSHEEEDEAVRLGRMTDWTASPPIRGVGQREFLIGEEVVPVMELKRLSVARHGA